MRMSPIIASGLLILLLAVPSATARVYVAQEAALNSAFPPPQQVERRVLYLDDEQARRAAEQAGAPVETRVIPYYVGSSDDAVTGFLYFDTHMVRTLPETILVQLSPQGRVVRVEVVSFDEPEDYLPGVRWLRQFENRSLDDSLAIGGRIHALAGASLSARAVTAAVRRVLTLHDLYVTPSGKKNATDTQQEEAP